MTDALKNSVKLTRFDLKRERIMSAIWVIGVALFSILLAVGMENMFDETARNALAVTLSNPGIVAMMGPVYGADHYTVGAMYANTLFVWVGMAVAVMNIFLVIRHTRTDEENGCREMIAALPVGRLSGLHAAMLTSLIVNTALGILHVFGLYFMKVDSMDFKGCFIYGTSLALLGLVFAGITAVFCQLFSSSKAALGASLAALGIIYMIRAAGDMSNETLALISPMGLMLRAKPFVENKSYTLLILFLEAAVFFAVAYILNSVRDVGQGFVPAKPGRKTAPAYLHTYHGLAFRLLKNTMLIWALALFMFAAAYGSVLADIETFISKSELYAHIIGANPDYPVSTMFAAMVNYILSLLACVPVLMAVLKVRSEEKKGRMDFVLSRPVCRLKYACSFVVIAVISSVLCQIASALGLYAAGMAVLKEPIKLSFLLKADLVYLPALWVMIGLAVLLIGAVPRFTNAVWVYFGASFYLTFLNRILDLPDWLVKVTPFGYIPQLPTDEIEYPVLAILTALAVVLMAVGAVFYKRRDIEA